MKYKAIVSILVLADVYVNACIKKAVKVLFMKRTVTICLLLLFLFCSFSLIDAIDSLMNTKVTVIQRAPRMKATMIWLCCLQLKKLMLRLTVMHQMI